MRKYTNDTGKSTISHYEIGEEFIRIQFKKELKEYDNVTHSKVHVDKMKTLALYGKGLARYIITHVADGKVIQIKKQQTKFQSFKSMLSMLLLIK